MTGNDQPAGKDKYYSDIEHDLKNVKKSSSRFTKLQRLISSILAYRILSIIAVLFLTYYLFGTFYLQELISSDFDNSHSSDIFQKFAFSDEFKIVVFTALILFSLPTISKRIVAFLEIQPQVHSSNVQTDKLVKQLIRKELDQNRLYEAGSSLDIDKMEAQLKTSLEKHLDALVSETTEREIAKGVADNLLHKIGKDPAVTNLSNLINEIREERRQVTVKANLLLLVGTFLALISWAATASMFFENSIVDALENGKSITGLVALRTITSLFGASFALFFLQQYRNGAADRKFYQNEISNMTAIMSAVLIAQRNEDTKIHEKVITKLMEIERNFVLKKGETTSENQRIGTEYQLIEKLLDRKKT